MKIIIKRFLKKAGNGGGHKYIRRMPKPGGGYIYIYKESKNSNKNPSPNSGSNGPKSGKELYDLVMSHANNPKIGFKEGVKQVAEELKYPVDYVFRQVEDYYNSVNKKPESEKPAPSRLKMATDRMGQLYREAKNNTPEMDAAVKEYNEAMKEARQMKEKQAGQNSPPAVQKEKQAGGRIKKFKDVLSTATGVTMYPNSSNKTFFILVHDKTGNDSFRQDKLPMSQFGEYKQAMKDAGWNYRKIGKPDSQGSYDWDGGSWAPNNGMGNKAETEKEKPAQKKFDTNGLTKTEDWRGREMYLKDNPAYDSGKYGIYLPAYESKISQAIEEYANSVMDKKPAKKLIAGTWYYFGKIDGKDASIARHIGDKVDSHRQISITFENKEGEKKQGDETQSKAPLDLSKQYVSYNGNNMIRVQFSKNKNDENYTMWNLPANGDKSKKVKINEYVTLENAQHWIEQNAARQQTRKAISSIRKAIGAL